MNSCFSDFLFDSTVWLHSASCYSPVNSRKTKYLGVCVISHSNSLQWNLMLFWSGKTIQCCHVGDFIYWKHTSLSLTVRGKCLLTAVHSWDFTDKSIWAVKICWLSPHCCVENIWHNFFLKTRWDRHNSCQINHDFICFSQWHQCFRKKFPLTARCTRSLNTLRYHSCEDVIEANQSSCRIHRPPNTFKLSTAALMGKRRWSCARDEKTCFCGGFCFWKGCF